MAPTAETYAGSESRLADGALPILTRDITPRTWFSGELVWLQPAPALRTSWPKPPPVLSSTVFH